MAARDLTQQIAESDERSLSQGLEIGDRLLRREVEPGHAPQDGKEASQRPHVPRRRDRLAQIDQPLHVATEGVDDRVDGLVRHRLALVRAAPQHLGVAVLFELVDEVVDEGRLAQAGRAGDPNRDRVAAARGLERVAKRAEVPFATYERETHLGRGGRRQRAAAPPGPEPAQDLGAGRPFARVATEQRAAQRVELRRDAVDALARRDRIERVLHREHVDRRARERRPPDEGLVEHDAHAVPVACGVRRFARALLGRHVPWGPDDELIVVGGRLLRGRGARQLGRDAEIEEHDPPGRRHLHVGRLDVAVQLARRVEHLDPLDELHERSPQSLQVRRRLTEERFRLRRRAGRRQRAPGLCARPAGVGRPIGRPGDRDAEHVRQEVRSRHELHREEDGSLVRDDELEEVHQVRVVNVGESSKLLFESIERSRTETKERLQRNALPAIAIEGLVDRAHTARADETDDLVSSGAFPLFNGIQCAGGVRRVCGHQSKEGDRPHPSIE